MQKGSKVFELGCGNGRDALFFAQNGIKVIACDKAEEGVNKLNGTENLYSFVGDFTQLNDHHNDNPHISEPVDFIYSRWTIHAINKESSSRTLQWSFRNLNSGGRLLIEVRSVNDNLFGQGTQVELEKDAFITDHYRRFVRNEELIDELKEIGFEIEENVESQGLAVHKDDDPVVIRVIAVKRQE